jgi:PTS system nitrogen regulatory IIA component
MLDQILHVDRVTTALAADDKEGALRILAEMFTGLDVAAVHRVLAERETLASTGVGSGVAIPHGRLPGLSTIQAALGICREGVPFDAIDGRPVHIFVAILAPEQQSSQHLKVLARVSRVLRDATTRARLLEARTADEAMAIVLGAASAA